MARTYKRKPGDRLGMLKMIGPVSRRSITGRQMFKFVCDCGKTIVTEWGKRSCGCMRGRKRPAAKIGDRYERLTVTAVLTVPPGSNRRLYAFRCDCGNMCDGAWRSIKSCGCLRKETCAGIGRTNALLPGEATLRRMFRTYRNNAEHRDVPFALTQAQFRALVTAACHYCGAPPQPVSTTGRRCNGTIACNGIDRSDSSKGYCRTNCVPCCAQCNYAKRDLSVVEFLAWVDQIYHHAIKQVDELCHSSTETPGGVRGPTSRSGSIALSDRARNGRPNPKGQQSSSPNQPAHGERQSFCSKQSQGS